MIINIIHTKFQSMMINFIDFIVQQIVVSIANRTFVFSILAAFATFAFDDDDFFDSSMISISPQLYYTFSVKFLLIEQMNYFDFDYKKEKQTTMSSSFIESIINANKHVYYKNVYVFVNRFKNLKSQHEHQLMKNVIKSCFRDDA